MTAMQANGPKRACADLELIYGKLSDVMPVNHNDHYNNKMQVEP